MMSDVVYKYLHETDISPLDYLFFLKKFYKERAEYRLQVRYEWYKKYLGFHCLLAICNNEIIGQSCAFRVRMMTPDGEKEWWWGCDSFVLEEARGKGVGKGLQNKLFDDHPNFSSIGYSRTNGIIKKKVGARPIALTYPSLYVIDGYFSVLFSLLMTKLFRKNIVIKIPNLIDRKNRQSQLKDVILSESSFTEENCTFINRILSEQYSYYIIRDKRYLTWKYEANPSVRYHLIELRKQDKLAGIVLASIVFEGSFHGYPLKQVKLLDYFIDPNSGLEFKHVIFAIREFYQSQRQVIDGITGINKGDYNWTITYPKAGKDVLSSFTDKLHNAYLSSSDQDLDQIRILESINSTSY